MRTYAAPIVFFLLAVLGLALLPSCSTAPTSNRATDVVTYAEPKADCKPVYTTDDLETARCTMPNGAKIYCTMSPRAQGSAAVPWSCVTLAAAPAPVAGPAQPASLTPPIPEPQPAQPTPRPLPVTRPPATP